MTVTIQPPVRVDRSTYRLAWSSDLTSPTYKIYQDGKLIRTTTAESHDFSVRSGVDLVVEIIDDESSPAESYPGRFTLGWYAVANAAKYQIQEYLVDTWTTRATVTANNRGFYTWQTRFLEDSTLHQFRVVPIGTNGNSGEALEISKFMVRHPDAPTQDFSYSNATNTVTINA